MQPNNNSNRFNGAEPISEPVVSNIHASRLLEKTVVDSEGKRLGRVHDILVEPGEEYPRVVGLEVSLQGQKKTIRRIPWSLVHVLIREYISLRVKRGDALEDVLPGNLVHLGRDILDKQIVDLNGLRVHRVNDLQLAGAGGDLRLVAADVGFRGLLRRLGYRPLVHLLDRFLRRPIPDVLIAWRNVEPIVDAPDQVRLSVPFKRLSSIHPADLADILEALDRPQRSVILSALDLDVAAETLQEMEPKAQAATLAHLGTDRASDILESMPADEAADILSDLPEQQARELLEEMEDEEAENVRELLEYEDKTAGRLMTTDVISFPANQTCAVTINDLRRLKPDPDAAYYLYVVDSDCRLLGVLSLRDLVVSDPEALLKDVMDQHVVSVHKGAGQQEVAELMAKYDLLALPVVDDEGRLAGCALIHDVVDDVFLSGRRRLATFQ